MAAVECDVKKGAAWVEDFEKEYGHGPTPREMEEIDYRLKVGDAAAPKVEGCQKGSPEEMDGAKGRLDELNERIRTMENIESRMREVDGSEIRMASGLSPGGYSVYRQLMASLKAIGGVQSRFFSHAMPTNMPASCGKRIGKRTTRRSISIGIRLPSSMERMRSGIEANDGSSG